MKRLVFSLIAAAFAFSFQACEGHKAETLPPHYQHRLHHDDAGHGKKDAGHDKKDGEVAKPAAH